MTILRARCVVRLAALAALSQPVALGKVTTLGSSVDAWRNGLRPACGVPRMTESHRVPGASASPSCGVRGAPGGSRGTRSFVEATSVRDACKRECHQDEEANKIGKGRNRVPWASAWAPRARDSRQSGPPDDRQAAQSMRQSQKPATALRRTPSQCICSLHGRTGLQASAN